VWLCRPSWHCREKRGRKLRVGHLGKRRVEQKGRLQLRSPEVEVSNRDNKKFGLPLFHRAKGNNKEKVISTRREHALPSC
jgi:hypothetical protein